MNFYVRKNFDDHKNLIKNKTEKQPQTNMTSQKRSTKEIQLTLTVSHSLGLIDKSPETHNCEHFVDLHEVEPETGDESALVVSF